MTERWGDAVDWMRGRPSSLPHFNWASPDTNTTCPVHIFWECFHLFVCLLVYILCVWILSDCMSVHHVYARCLRKSEEGTRFVGLELQMAMSCHAGTGNRTQVLLKASSTFNLWAIFHTLSLAIGLKRNLGTIALIRSIQNVHKHQLAHCKEISGEQHTCFICPSYGCWFICLSSALSAAMYIKPSPPWLPHLDGLRVK